MIRWLKRRKANKPYNPYVEGQLIAIHVVTFIGWVWVCTLAAETEEDGALLMNAILIMNLTYVLLALAAHFQKHFFG